MINVPAPRIRPSLAPLTAAVVAISATLVVSMWPRLAWGGACAG